jgi:hypothetical protein
VRLIVQSMRFRHGDYKNASAASELAFSVGRPAGRTPAARPSIAFAAGTLRTSAMRDARDRKLGFRIPWAFFANGKIIRTVAPAPGLLLACSQSAEFEGLPLLRWMRTPHHFLKAYDVDARVHLNGDMPKSRLAMRRSCLSRAFVLFPPGILMWIGLRGILSPIGAARAHRSRLAITGKWRRGPQK